MGTGAASKRARDTTGGTLEAEVRRRAMDGRPMSEKELQVLLKREVEGTIAREQEAARGQAEAAAGHQLSNSLGTPLGGGGTGTGSGTGPGPGVGRVGRRNNDALGADDNEYLDADEDEDLGAHGGAPGNGRAIVSHLMEGIAAGRAARAELLAERRRAIE